jgi:restriction system protein
MARGRSFITSLAKMQRAIEREQRAQQKAQEKAQKAAARAYVEKQRTQEKNQKAAQKLAAQTYLEQRMAETDDLNQELEDKIRQLESILFDTLLVDDYLDLETLKEKPVYPIIDIPKHLKEETPNKPQLDRFMPQPLTTFQKLIPGAKRKHEDAVQAENQQYKEAMQKYLQREELRKKSLQTLKDNHQQQIKDVREAAEEQHRKIDEFKVALEVSEPEAIMNYCTLVLESSEYPEDFPQHAKIAYVPESKQLVIEFDLPRIDVVPDVKAYKYTKTKDEISSTAKPATERKSLYRSVIAQITIRTIHEVFEADRLGHVETMVFNGYVNTVDKGTGLDTRTCLVTVRTTRDIFMKYDLARIEPESCLKTLNASVSSKPDELAPVRPVVEFNMVDSRFIEETDVISTLDQRPNLMDLTPGEFESLITNLFQKMGLEARLTQASRDGGVDCVAFDPRPIFGGKVVIQAKRYKHTVGVSAVRDLFGTLQNEGASKGILVTTSGYGKAAFEFAEGKPIELISGSNLLHLLAEYAGIEARIVMPIDGKDPIPDSGE